MNDFKVGDMVIVIGENHNKFNSLGLIGRIGKIITIPDIDVYKVDFFKPIPVSKGASPHYEPNTRFIRDYYLKLITKLKLKKLLEK